jgi:mevalonate kinase
MILSCPSKTFLCGEYGVLAGGRALVVTHEPRFQLTCTHSVSPRSHSPGWLHPESPAGKLFALNLENLKDFDFEFLDPHSGKGGFGASGAQFVLLHEFIRHLKNQTDKILPGVLLKEFKSLDPSKSSGADVLAQTLGQIAQLDLTFPQNSRGRPWPFLNLEILVIPTGTKSNTFEHLSSLDERALNRIKELSENVVNAFEAHNQNLFLSSLNQFKEGLITEGFCLSSTQSLISSFEECPGVKAIKPCGAMGSDTILMVIESAQLQPAQKFLREFNMRSYAVGSASEKSFGLKMELP